MYDSRIKGFGVRGIKDIRVEEYLRESIFQRMHEMVEGACKANNKWRLLPWRPL